MIALVIVLVVIAYLYVTDMTGSKIKPERERPPYVADDLPPRPPSQRVRK